MVEGRSSNEVHSTVSPARFARLPETEAMVPQALIWSGSLAALVLCIIHNSVMFTHPWRHPSPAAEEAESQNVSSHSLLTVDSISWTKHITPTVVLALFAVQLD
jgi:hypothetical protein